MLPIKKFAPLFKAKILWSYGKALFGPKVYFLAPNYDLFGPAYETKWQPCLFTLAKANSKVSSARFLHLLIYLRLGEMQDQCEQVRPISRDNTCAPVLSGSNLDLGLVSLHSHS